MSQRHRSMRAVLALCACASSGCQAARETPVDPVVGSESANVGLFAPGSTLGASVAAAGADAAAGAVVDVAPSGDRCTGTSGTAGTPCMLTLTFSTTPIGEHWGPANIGAVWIEDASGTYIKTIERWAAIRSRALYHWLDHACAARWPEMDAVSQATLADHKGQHSATWDGKDLNGKLVPDGMYRLFIEVTETETNYGPMAMLEFEKGASASMQTPPDMPPYTGLLLSYSPSAGGSDMSAGQGHAPSDAGGGTDASVPGDAGTIAATGAGSTSGSETPPLPDAGAATP